MGETEQKLSTFVQRALTVSASLGLAVFVVSSVFLFAPLGPPESPTANFFDILWLMAFLWMRVFWLLISIFVILYLAIGYLDSLKRSTHHVDIFIAISLGFVILPILLSYADHRPHVLPLIGSLEYQGIWGGYPPFYVASAVLMLLGLYRVQRFRRTKSLSISSTILYCVWTGLCAFTSGLPIKLLSGFFPV